MVYRDAIKVVLHRMGCIRSDSPVTTEELLKYIQETFGVSEDYHATLLKKERNEEVSWKLASSYLEPCA